MVSYLNSAKKNTSDILYIDFKLYGNIFIHSWVDLDPFPMRGVAEENFRRLKKGWMI